VCISMFVTSGAWHAELSPSRTNGVLSLKLESARTLGLLPIPGIRKGAMSRTSRCCAHGNAHVDHSRGRPVMQFPLVGFQQCPTQVGRMEDVTLGVLAANRDRERVTNTNKVHP
jgi:hypothetical protein